MGLKMNKLTHHVHDYECMWNGIEDLYIRDTGEKLPPSFFFTLSSFGTFCYMKTPKANLKRMIALGDGRTKNMYEFLAPIVGFEFKHYEYKTFNQALKKAKAEIDQGYFPVLGSLDMYHLPYYPKLYHGDHIPYHYVLMIGYDETKREIYLLDCGKEEVLELSYDDLDLAWNCSSVGLSQPYTVCKIRMSSHKDKYQIAKEALLKKADSFLNPPVNFVGRKGFEKFINELATMKEEITTLEYDKILRNMVMFFGTVPTIPNALLGIDEPDTIMFHGGFDKISIVLKELGKEQKNERWIKAAFRFDAGAFLISKIKDIIVNYLAGIDDNTCKLPLLFTDVLQVLVDGFTLLKENEVNQDS